MASTHKTAKVNYPNLDLMKFFLALLVVERYRQDSFAN